MRKITLCLSVALAGLFPILAYAAPQPAPAEYWQSDTPQVFADGTRLHYYGALNETGVEKLRAVFETAPEIREVHIASPGGDLAASIEVGEQIHTRGIEVVVVGIGCFSGCANYVFTPAVRRRIAPESLVMWHYSCPARIPLSRRAIARRLKRSYGTAAVNFSAGKTQDGTDDPRALREAFDRNFERMVDSTVANVRTVREGHQRIFQATGIDDRVICLTDHLVLPKVAPRHIGYLYTLSPEDMARFGVCNVDARSDYAEWAARHIAGDDALSEYAGVVRLADHPRFRPHPARDCADLDAVARDVSGHR